MEDHELSFDQMDRLVHERKEFINESIINECETSLHTIKNQMLELKSRLYRPIDKTQDSSFVDKSIHNITNRSASVPHIDEPPHKVNDLLQENYKFEAELARLKDENESYKRQLATQTEQIAYLNHRSTSHHDTLTSELSEKLKNKLEHLERENGELVAKNARLENELAIHKAYHQSNQMSEELQLNLTRRVQELEIQNLKLGETNEYLTERVRTLESSYRNVKSNFDQNVTQYEGLLSKIRDNEEDKEKYIHHAKKLDEQLKNLNLNYVALQKKASTLEKDHKELQESYKHLENEKRSIAEKWLRLSKRTRTEENNRMSKKSLESSIQEKSHELEDLREKFASASTELAIIRESERTYKELLEERSKEIRLLNERYESDTKDKETLLTHNLELIEKLERLQSEAASTSKKTEHMFKDKEEMIRTKNNLSNIQKTLKKLEVENEDLSKRLIESTQEIERHYKRRMEVEQLADKLRAELNYTNQKWQYLIKEHERLKEDHTKLLSNLRSEGELFDSLQKKSFDRETTSTTRILFPYEPSSDSFLSSLKAQINKIQSIDSTLCEQIIASLDAYIENLIKTLDIDAVNNRYNKLLVKYYKSLERSRDNERHNYMRTDPIDESNIETLSLDTSGFRSVFQSASIQNRPHVQFEDVSSDKKSLGTVSTKNLFDSFENANPHLGPMRLSYKEPGSRSNSSEKRNPLLSVPEILRNHNSNIALLNNNHSDPYSSTGKGMKASRSVERLGVPKKHVINPEPIKDLASPYAPTPLSEAAKIKLSMLKKMTSETPTQKKKLNLSISSSGSKVNKSYSVLHSTKNNNTGSTGMNSVLNNSVEVKK